jgi:hypothetical protein
MIHSTRFFVNSDTKKFMTKTISNVFIIQTREIRGNRENVSFYKKTNPSCLKSKSIDYDDQNRIKSTIFKQTICIVMPKCFTMILMKNMHT